MRSLSTSFDYRFNGTLYNISLFITRGGFSAGVQNITLDKPVLDWHEQQHFQTAINDYIVINNHFKKYFNQ